MNSLEPDPQTGNFKPPSRPNEQASRLASRNDLGSRFASRPNEPASRPNELASGPNASALPGTYNPGDPLNAPNILISPANDDQLLNLEDQPAIDPYSIPPSYVNPDASPRSQHRPPDSVAIELPRVPKKLSSKLAKLVKKYKDFQSLLPTGYEPEIPDIVSLPDIESIAFQFQQTGDIYVGQWRWGRRHGRGTLYKRDFTIVEGYWRHNKAHGRVRVFHPNHHIYMGEAENNEANGKGEYLSLIHI
eukprot:TRINITY_DN7303_c0_g1_i2.p1 TRINITY_DN7303_c0_g1~~TRINITY_DN7303_c0_g1_i2.p1  ORF type:complete len:247 (+),score=29.12 TRINITY_DN7303_c0_g1_i2:17-757(+)